MVRLSKSVLPRGVTIKSEDDYRKGEVFDTLVKDCHGKCYICEIKPTTINVEHIKPHRSDPELKYEWSNLFISCGHCNSIKNVKFDDVINPAQCDPEEHIALSAEMNDEMIDHVNVKPLADDESTTQTAQLLEYVYNGGSTEIKDIECANLRNSHLLPNLRLFYQYVKNYREEPNLGYADKIKKEIDRSSAFAAFKRKIVRDDPELSKEFF